VSTVGADGERRPDFEQPVRRLGPHADDLAVVFEEVGDLGLHAEIEGRIESGVVVQEVEEVPLRHKRDEFGARRQVGEIGDRHRHAADIAGKNTGFLMRAFQELFQEAEFVHHFESGGVDGVAAEIAQEVGVLFEDGDGDAGPRE
jgi:hypothetical protein